MYGVPVLVGLYEYRTRTGTRTAVGTMNGQNETKRNGPNRIMNGRNRDTDRDSGRDTDRDRDTQTHRHTHTHRQRSI